MAQNRQFYVESLAPTVNIDSSKGYAISDVIVVGTSIYVAQNVNVSAAVWILQGGGGVTIQQVQDLITQNDLLLTT